MFYYLSRVKNKFIQNVLKRKRNQKVIDLQKALLYPPDLARAESLLLSVLDKSSISTRNLSAISKPEIKSLSYSHLLLLHKYYNCILEVKKGCVVFHELLRRDSKVLRLLRSHGFKRFLLSHILRSGLYPTQKLNPTLYKILLALLFRVTNKKISAEQFSLLRSKSAVIIGGAADYGGVQGIAKGKDIICGINRLETYDMLCDISYFRGEALLDIDRKGQFGRLRGGTAFLSVKLPLMLKKFPEGKSALTTNIDLATPYGTLNACPTICLDLIRYQVKKIKLICVDFNIGGWGSNYKPVHSTLINKSLIFGQHPAPLQFLIIKSLANYYDISLANNPYISIGHSYRSFINIFEKQCKMFGGER